MNSISTFNKNQGALFNLIMVLYLVSMFYSKFLLSVCLIVLLLWSFYTLFTKKLFKSTLQVFTKEKVFSIFLMVFIGVLLSGINSENIFNWLHHLKLRLPFIFLPFAFFVFKEEVAKNYYHYLLVFLAICFISSIPILIDYLKNTEEIIYRIGVGQSFEGPIDHIKYSLFLAFGCITGFVLFITKPTAVVRKYENLVLFVSIFLFIFLHVLAVRSGLAVLYITMFLLLIRSLFRLGPNKNMAFIGLIVLLLIPLIAIKTVPSLKQKIAYMKYDYEMYLQGKGQNYSDSERLISYKVGWDIFKSSPVLGVGMGDLLDVSNAKTKELFDRSTDKYPHNMYLFVLSGMGVLGFVLFFAAFIYPLYYYLKDLEIIFLAFNLIILTSFLVENTIQRSYSTAFYLFFVLAGICYMYQKKRSQNAI